MVRPSPQPDRALQLAVTAFIISRESEGCSARTVEAYQYALRHLLAFLRTQGVRSPQEITATHLRTFLLSLQGRYKDTTVHLHARSIKTFLRWLVAEEELPSSPMERVAMPRLSQTILPAFSPDQVKRLLAACGTERDKAIVLCLLDSGCRAAEFINLDMGDVDLRTGQVRVRLGKGGKDRITFLGAKARRALARYLMRRGQLDPDAPLWISQTTGERLSYTGLALLLKRLGKAAGVQPCSPHAFRRSFALWSLRAGMNVYALQHLMGHSDLTVLHKYLAIAREDLAQAHRDHGAVDNIL